MVSHTPYTVSGVVDARYKGNWVTVDTQQELKTLLGLEYPYIIFVSAPSTSLCSSSLRSVHFSQFSISIKDAWEVLGRGGKLAVDSPTPEILSWLKWRFRDSTFQGIIRVLPNTYYYIFKKEYLTQSRTAPEFPAEYPDLFKEYADAKYTLNVVLPGTMSITDLTPCWCKDRLIDILPYYSLSWRMDDIQNISDRLYTLGKAKTIFPPLSQVFTILEKVPPNKVKVVILGQDPYINPGEAIGIAFDHSCNTPEPPSLKNIYKKLRQDGYTPDITDWPDKGVLLYNVCLTVTEGASGSHGKLWSTFTKGILQQVGKEEDIAWILLGGKAQAYKKHITNPTHKVFETVHPSPLSAHKGFFDTTVFKDVCEWLLSRGIWFTWNKDPKW